MVAVLWGSVVFLSDLLRRLPLRLTVHGVGVRSYGGRSIRSKGARFYLPLEAPLAGRHVLVVDDILDSGQTLRVVLDKVAACRPASVRTCVLLRKPPPQDDRSPQRLARGGLPRASPSRVRRAGPSRIEPDFVGFDIGSEFVVGYGLDYDGRYRNLADLCVLKRHDRAARRPN